MATSDPVTILLDHNHWANRQIAQACASLSEEQLHHRFEMGLGSLHDTLVHIAGAMKGWTDLLAGRPFGQRPEGSRRSVAEITSMLDEAHADFLAHARTGPVDQMFTRERGGKSYTFARGAVLTHVTTHGMHHRAQCLNMLRQLGVSPLPSSSVMEWTFTGDPAR